MTRHILNVFRRQIDAIITERILEYHRGLRNDDLIGPFKRSWHSSDGNGSMSAKPDADLGNPIQRVAKEWAQARCDVLATSGQVSPEQYDRLARAEASLYALTLKP